MVGWVVVLNWFWGGEERVGFLLELAITHEDLGGLSGVALTVFLHC